MAREDVDDGLILPAVPDLTVREGLRDRLRPWWLLGVVTVLYSLAHIERGGLPLLVNPIKADLGLGDVQMSLILGFAYTGVQCLLLLPAGYLVDRFSRRAFLATLVAACSAIAGMTSFVGSFGQLFLNRSGLAAAEAGVGPAAVSMVRDAFPPARRSMALSILFSADNLAGGLGLVITGALIALGERGFFHDWPGLGQLKTWQLVLAVPGLCGLPFALLMLSVREPARRASAVISDDRSSNRDAIRYVWRHRWVYLPFIAAFSLTSYPTGAMQWMPTVLIRGWGLPAAEIAHVTGIVGASVTIGGMVIGGYVMDRLMKRGAGDGPWRLFILMKGIGGAANLAVLHVREPWQIFTLLGIAVFVNAIQHATGAVMVAYLTPSRLFGRVYAFYYASYILLIVPSPTLLALFAKYCYSGKLALIPAFNSYFAVTVILGQIAAVFAAWRVARFRQLYPQGAG